MKRTSHEPMVFLIVLGGLVAVIVTGNPDLRIRQGHPGDGRSRRLQATPALVGAPRGGTHREPRYAASARRGPGTSLTSAGNPIDYGTDAAR